MIGMEVIALEKKENELKPRTLYLQQLCAFQDTEPVKIVTGIRRCGKSSLMKLMIQHLQQTGIGSDQILQMNFESMALADLTAKELYAYVKERILPGKRMYLFFDEVQRIPSWETAINSFRVDFDCDIYVTGSNSRLLSSEYATYLSGRSVEIKMLPLSFAEFMEFHGFTRKHIQGPDGQFLWRIYDAAGNLYLPDELLSAYMKFGGMPGIADVGLNTDKAMILMDGIYSTVVVRDILERERIRGQRQITDPELLRKIIMFLADNIGNSTSLTSVANTLFHEKLLARDMKQGKPSVQTVQAYIHALCESYVFYPVKRFDIKGKDYLRTLGKYYIVDTGLRNYLLGSRDMDTGHVLENIIYFELLRRGYDVAVGKIDTKEIDFIASKGNEKIYYQVTESMQDGATRQRELVPLEKIRDNYPKVVLTRYGEPGTADNGIKCMRVTDFLLEY